MSFLSPELPGDGTIMSRFADIDLDQYGSVGVGASAGLDLGREMMNSFGVSAPSRELMEYAMDYLGTDILNDIYHDSSAMVDQIPTSTELAQEIVNRSVELGHITQSNAASVSEALASVASMIQEPIHGEYSSIEDRLDQVMSQVLDIGQSEQETLANLMPIMKQLLSSSESSGQTGEKVTTTVESGSHGGQSGEKREPPSREFGQKHYKDPSRDPFKRYPTPPVIDKPSITRPIGIPFKGAEDIAEEFKDYLESDAVKDVTNILKKVFPLSGIYSIFE